MLEFGVQGFEGLGFLAFFYALNPNPFVGVAI